MNRTLYFIRPHAPLVFRSGRPFGDVQAADGNQDSAGPAFPLPSSTAGALRAAWVDGANHAVTANDQTLLHLQVHGGLQALRYAGNPELQAFAPVPADCRLTEPLKNGMWSQQALCPQPLPPGTLCSLPHGLWPVRQRAAQAESPPPDAWNFRRLQQWLLNEAPGELDKQNSTPALQRDLREHVVINPQTLSHQPGGYFQTEGLSFQHQQAEQGVVAWLQGPQTDAAHGRVSRYGADGRAASFEALPEASAPWLQADEALAEALDALQPGDWFRLLLVTPACYARNGWYPDAMRPVDAADSGSFIEGPLVPFLPPAPKPPKPGRPQLQQPPASAAHWRFRLRAVALPGWQPLAASNGRNDKGLARFERRSLHRLVPAGTVYWFEILQRGALPLSHLWLQPTCRTEFARDGFGLALPGLASTDHLQQTN